MSSSQDFMKRGPEHTKNSATIKMFSIGFLILILLIPTALITRLVGERSSRRHSVVSDISSKWGASQTITGPFLTVPYKSYYQDADKQTKFEIKHLYILPEKLEISGEIKPEVRYRGLYEAVLYNSALTFTGNFKVPDPTQISVADENIFWNESFLSIGISDLIGVQERITVNLDGYEYECNPGLKTQGIAGSGVGSLVRPITVGAANSFAFNLNLNGSERLFFTPIGEETAVKLSSKWSSPSFSGAFLPKERTITKDGFTADWKVLHLNRNYPQYFTDSGQYYLAGSDFGLNLVMTADIYQKVTRVTKYAAMFIVFTFAAFFFSEILSKSRLHPIQYILVGLAILLFYTLLLSLSEYINFNLAYIFSSLVITLIITYYSGEIMSSKKFAITIFSILTILYAYLFIVLQLEDYALIMGSVGLLIVLTATMYITRKIDWYSIGEGEYFESEGSK